MTNRPICFDGYFAKSHINGVPRYAMEIIKRLDELLDIEMVMVLPSSATNIPNFKRIQLVYLDKGDCLGGTLWELFSFKPYVNRINGIPINMTNRLEWTKGGITTIHDLIKLRKDKYIFELDVKNRIISELKRFLECEWNKYQIKQKAKNAERIVTVSEFSKSELSQKFGIENNKISVIGNGWEHLNSVNENNEVIDSRLLPGNYYFSVGNILPHKNMQWILEVSKYNPHDLFVISGKMPFAIKSIVNSDLPNVIFTGYISDGYMKYLMRNSKALLMPSFIEGFGIPPLEKLALGGQVVVSDIPVFRELFENSVHYIDPNKYDIDLDELLSNPVDSSNQIIDMHSWETSAKEWAKLIIDVAKYSEVTRGK